MPSLRSRSQRQYPLKVKPHERIYELVCQSVLGTRFDVTAVGKGSVLSKVLATLAAVALAIVLGIVDYLTGREWAISAFYLLPTCLAMGGRAVDGVCVGSFVHGRMVPQR